MQVLNTSTIIVDSKNICRDKISLESLEINDLLENIRIVFNYIIRQKRRKNKMKNLKKNNWQIKKLGDVCDFEGGSQPPKVNFIHEPKEGYVRFLQIRDFGSDKYITYIPDSNKNRYCTEEDILLGRYGASVGKILINKKGAYNVAVMKTMPNLDILDKKYFYFYLISDDFQERLNKVAARSAQAGFSKDDIYDFPIIIPPLSEQHRIVKILDEVFENVAKAKENAEKNLKNSKEIFESYLQDIFRVENKDWEIKKLNEISKNLDNKRVPITKNVRNSGKYPYYGASGIVDHVNNYIFDEDLLLVSEDGANLLARTYPIAFSVSGKIWVNNHAHVLKFEKKESQIFAEYYLNSIKLDPYVSGMAQPKLNQKMLNSIEIPYPSFAEQKSIVKKLDALSAETKKLEGIYRQKLADLEELKKSVLKSAFAGEL